MAKIFISRDGFRVDDRFGSYFDPNLWLLDNASVGFHQNDFFQLNLGDGVTLHVFGIGFTYDIFGNVQSTGSISSLRFTDSIGEIAFIDYGSASIALIDFLNTIHSQNLTAYQTLLFAGNDEIFDAYGNSGQIFYGGIGANSLHGSGGDDVFALTTFSASDPRDQIFNFIPGQDLVDLSLLVAGIFMNGKSLSERGYSELYNYSFVQYDQLGTDAIIRIDPDGSAGPAGAVEVARLAGIRTDQLGPHNVAVSATIHSSNGFAIGTQRPDRLVGDDDDDHLVGLGGADVLTGGAGRDIFDVRERALQGEYHKYDVVTDFNPQQDVLDLSLLIVSINPRDDFGLDGYLNLGYLRFVEVANVGTFVHVDPDGRYGPDHFYNVVALLGVTPGQLNADNVIVNLTGHEF